MAFPFEQHHLPGARNLEGGAGAGNAAADNDDLGFLGGAHKNPSFNMAAPASTWHGRRFAEAAAPGPVASAAALGEIVGQRILPGTVLQGEISHHRHRLACDRHALQPRPDGAALAHLMRLQFAELGKAGLALDRQRAGGNGRIEQLQPAPGAHDDAVERFILNRRPAIQPGVRDGDIRHLADRVGANLAARLDHPLVLVFPQLPVAEFEGAAILRFDPVGAGIAMPR